jgi:hypothetical protein
MRRRFREPRTAGSPIRDVAAEACSGVIWGLSPPFGIGRLRRGFMRGHPKVEIGANRDAAESGRPIGEGAEQRSYAVDPA